MQPATIERVPLEAFNFSNTVVLPDGSSADVQQTDIHRGNRRDMTFFVAGCPHAPKAFAGALHISGSSLSHVEACPGDTRAEKSARVADAFRAWVRRSGTLNREGT